MCIFTSLNFCTVHSPSSPTHTLEWRQTQILTKKPIAEMAICTTLLASIVISLLIIGSSVDGYDNARENEALLSKISTLAELSNLKEAEKNLQELKLSFEQLQRTNDKQARALELAEKDLKRAKLEASSKFEKLTVVLGSWLPPWLITHTNRVENLEVSFWKQRAKQSIIALINKTTEKMVHAKKWSEPHMGSAKNKWVPAVMQQFEIFMINTVPYMKELSTQTVEKAKSTTKPSMEKVQEMALRDYKKWVPAAKQQLETIMINMQSYMKKVSTETIEVYEVSKSTMKTHYDKVQEKASSYYKKWVPAAKQQLETIMINMQPYMKKLATKTIEVYEVSRSMMKTHYDKVQEMALSYYKEAWSYLMPYIEYAACMYCKHSGRNNTYRTQVKGNIDEYPRKHKLTRVYAMLASVMAFVLFAFSVFFLCRFLQSIFVTKKRKQLKRTFHACEPHRKPKRRRADV